MSMSDAQTKEFLRLLRECGSAYSTENIYKLMTYVDSLLAKAFDEGKQAVFDL